MGDGKRMHQTVTGAKNVTSGKDEIVIDVHESDPGSRMKLGVFLNSDKGLADMCDEELFCEMFAWKHGEKESRRNLEMLYELCNGVALSEEKMSEMIALYESMESGRGSGL